MVDKGGEGEGRGRGDKGEEELADDLVLTLSKVE